MKESFLRFFSHEVTKVKVAKKSTSSFMRAIAGFVPLGSGISRDSFLQDYTTTIGDTIYSDTITMDSRPTRLIVHELVHVLQFKRSDFALTYLFRPDKRAYYETEAVQAEVLCFDLVNSIRGSWFEDKVRLFVGYGCSEAIVRRELRRRLDEVERGEAKLRPRKVRDAFDEWHVLQSK